MYDYYFTNSGTIGLKISFGKGILTTFYNEFKICRNYFQYLSDVHKLDPNWNSEDLTTDFSNGNGSDKYHLLYVWLFKQF